MADIITLPWGEEVCLFDLMAGLDTLPQLPQRQRQAFTLICLLGYVETAARDVVLPGSESRVVAEYGREGLQKMLDFYDGNRC